MNNITGDALISKIGNKGTDMAIETKNVTYCKEGKHIVPSSEMTSIDTAHKNYRRPCCDACKDRIISLRKQVQANK